jgi:hypothetical protein
MLIYSGGNPLKSNSKLNFPRESFSHLLLLKIGN